MSKLWQDGTRTHDAAASAGFAGRARARRSDPQSPEAALILALEQLRRGQGETLVGELGRGLAPRVREALRRLARGLAGEGGVSDAGLDCLLLLVRLSTQLGARDRCAAAESVAALRDHEALPVSGKTRVRTLELLQGAAGVLTADLELLGQHLTTLQRAQDLPRRGATRLSWLAVLAGGLKPGERLKMEAFDRRMARARNALAKAYRYEWTLDDCHTRRYLTQFAFVERRPDGGAFWRAEARAARLLLSPRAAARVAAWWAAGPAPAPL